MGDEDGEGNGLQLRDGEGVSHNDQDILVYHDPAELNKQTNRQLQRNEK